MKKNLFLTFGVFLLGLFLMLPLQQGRKVTLKLNWVPGAITGIMRPKKRILQGKRAGGKHQRGQGSVYGQEWN
jgi:hypothetical protein